MDARAIGVAVLLSLFLAACEAPRGAGQKVAATPRGIVASNEPAIESGEATASCPPACDHRAQQLSRTDTPFPPAVMGVWWGMTPGQLSRACRDAGGSTADLDVDHVSCDTPIVDVGIPSSLQVTFCDGGACEVTVQPRDSSIAAFLTLQARLTERYGAAAASDARIRAPSRIAMGEGDPVAVCSEGAGRFWHRWGFRGAAGNATNIVLAARCAGGRMETTMVYRAAAGVRRRLEERARRQRNF